MIIYYNVYIPQNGYEPLEESDAKINSKGDQEIISNLLRQRIKGKGEVKGTHSWIEGSGI